MRDTSLRSNLLKNKYLSHDFETIRKIAYVNTCFISTDNQSPRKPK